MRTRAAKDEQTVAITSALGGAAALVGLPLLAAWLVVTVLRLDVDVPASAGWAVSAVYLALVVVLVRRRG